MKSYISLAAAAAITLSAQQSQSAVIAYEFNGGTTEGFSPGGAQSPTTANPYIDNLRAGLGIDGTTGVLTSDDINIDPQLLHAPVVLPPSDTWSTFEMRFRQLSLNPDEAGVTASAFSATGALVIIGGRNTMVIETGSTTVGGDTFVKTLTAEGAGEWQVYTIDLAGTSIEGNNLALRIDPIGNAAEKNFEIDYVRLTSVPEPGSAVLAGLAAAGLLLRRRRS